MPDLAPGLEKKICHRIVALKASGIRVFNKRVSNIPGIIKLTLGEPDMNTPEHVKQAAINSIKNNDSHYSVDCGKIELREAISNYLKDTIGIKYDPKTEVVATVGATEAINAVTFAIASHDEKIIVPTPVFSLYWPVANLADTPYRLVNVAPDNFILTPQRLEAAIKKEKGKVRAVILNYPTNPTGVEYSKEQLAALAEVAKKYNLFVITDEIYSTLVYGVKHYSIASMIPERTLYISGLSKSHAMTGYRLGYVCGPARIIKQINKVHDLLVTCPVESSQAAAIEALNNGRADPEVYRKVYQKRRDFVVDKLNQMGMKTVKPQGAFYVFAKIPAKFGQDDMKFAVTLARKAKVCVTPGSAFGPGGEGYVRLSYASSDKNLRVAMERIKKFLKED